jgi:hypothetical protein
VGFGDLGSSSGGGLWKKVKPSGVATPSTPFIIDDELAEGEFRAVHYIVTIWMGSETKSLLMGIVDSSTGLKSSVKWKLGDPISISLNESFVSGKMTLTLTNNETSDISVDIARIVTGKP